MTPLVKVDPAPVAARATGGTATGFSHRFTIAVLVLPALLQTALFCRTGSTAHRATGIALGVVALAISLWPRLSRRVRMIALWTASAAIACNLSLHLVEVAPAFESRILQVGVVLLYSALLLAALLAMIVRMQLDRALLLSLTFALSLWACEAVIERSAMGLLNTARWVGGTAPHPVLGEHYPPYSVARNFYPDNPRGYFEESDPATMRWRLSTIDLESTAALAFQKGGASPMRIDISRANRPEFWNIQLNQPGLALTAAPHRLSLRARSDAPRTISFAVIQAHEPWQSLGLYREVRLGPDWREFSETFTPVAGDSNAQVSFGLGGAATGVEIAGASLTRLPDGVAVEAKVTREYSVTYRFNGLGCRGHDYAIPRPPGGRRIVVLGDSFALGVGVHQRDTVASRLEESLNRRRPNPSDPAYEVITCAVSGYDTRDERLMYEQIASRYQPDIVLVLMVLNDYRSFRDDIRLGLVRPPTKMEQLLTSWHMVKLILNRAPKPDFAGCVTELLALRQECRSAGARLGVAFFRASPLFSYWRDLVSTVSSGLQGKGVPSVDLGNEIMRNRRLSDVVVHHRLDGHPNEIAHRVAAEELERFMQNQGWID